MSKSHSYILGINAYDHDVSACLLRDGEIAFAIAKERITRRKHATGFYQEVIDYCLKAEGGPWQSRLPCVYYDCHRGASAAGEP